MGVCRAPPRAIRESPLQCCWWLVGCQLAGRGLPSPWIPAFAGVTKRGRRAGGWARAPALRGLLVRQQQDAGDPAGCFGEVLDLVRLEGPAEDGALAVGEPLLEDLVAA